MRGNSYFIVLLMILLIGLLLSVWEGSQPLPPPSPYPKIDVEAVKAKLQKANITPTPAMFWDTLQPGKILDK